MRRKRIHYHWDVIGLQLVMSAAISGAEWLYNLPDITSLIGITLLMLIMAWFGYWPITFEKEIS